MVRWEAVVSTEALESLRAAPTACSPFFPLSQATWDTFCTCTPTSLPSTTNQSVATTRASSSRWERSQRRCPALCCHNALFHRSTIHLPQAVALDHGAFRIDHQSVIFQTLFGAQQQAASWLARGRPAGPDMPLSLSHPPPSFSPLTQAAQKTTSRLSAGASATKPQRPR